MSSLIPSSWLRLDLGDVIDYGSTQKIEPQEISPETWVLELEDVEKDSSRLLQRLNYAERNSKSTKNKFEAGDVLYGKLRPYLNKVVFADSRGVCTTEIIPLKANFAVNAKYLFYWLKHPRFLDYVTEVSHGVNMPRLGTEAGRKAPFVLAPENEQRRIAEKLDTVLTHVDALNDRLARITPLLKRFRQSVLAAATSGRLTEDWREETKLTTAWPLISLGEVAKDFSYGSAAKSSKVGDIPVLRMGNIKNGSLDWQDLVYTSDELEINKYRLCVGDVLFNRTNSPDLVGKTAVFKGEREAVYAGYLIRVKCSEKLDADFLNYCLGSPAGRDYCWKVKSDGVSQSNINAKKLAAFEFELPSIEEQTEIVRRVEILFAYADRLEARLQTARTAADRLTPALLAKAFRGELVPQDPNDEPATELLRRLREARAAEAPAKKTRGRKAVV